MENVIKLDMGLKENWREFGKIAKDTKSSSITVNYFVFHEEECDYAYVFHYQSDLEEWLEKSFWNGEHYDTNDFSTCMDEFQVWMLIEESRYERLNGLYKGAKLTSFLINGEKQYRKKIPTSVEPTFSITSNWY